jgi:ribosomal protein S18 acetylase RimI-like enzyme
MSASAPRTVFAIRPAVSCDAEALAEFGARTFFEAFSADNTAEDMRLHLASAWSPQLQRAEIEDPALDTLLACSADGELAAFAQLRAGWAPTQVSTKCAIELKRFYVDSPWHGKGLAHDLMSVVETQARRRGARELWLGVWERNIRAQAFYRKCGFEKIGTQIFVVGNDPQTDHVMLRNL